MNIKLTRPQFKFLRMPNKFKAYVGGFGSGKTWVGCCGIFAHHDSYPGVNSAYYGPTYRVIKDVFFPTIEEVAFNFDWRVRVRISDNEVEIYRHGSFLGVVKCRSMDKPGTIVGYKSGHSLVDELDTLAKAKAQDAWRKIIARMRYKIPGLKNGVDVTTTPEGYKFVYDRFKKNGGTDLYGLIQASTYENEANLNADYIPSLYDSYPEQLVNAYINGEFVNLVSLPVWGAYDEILNDSTEVVQKTDSLIVGMDFNVSRGCAVIYVRRNETLHAAGEIFNSYDTPDTIRVLKDRYPSNSITVYPDASGKSRKSVNATISDIALLKEAGFKVKANKKNPAIKDRVISTNRFLCDGNGIRRLFINKTLCPNLSDAAIQQVYDDNGLPEKGAGKFDDLTDSFSYPVAFLHPIKKPNAQRMEL